MGCSSGLKGRRAGWLHILLVTAAVVATLVPLSECRIVGGIRAIDGSLHTDTRLKHAFDDDSLLGGEENDFSTSTLKSVKKPQKPAAVPPEAKRIAMLTPYGPIRMSLLYNNAPETAKALYELASRQMQTCVDCQFYRAEARGEGGGPPYSLLQGSLGKAMTTPTEQEGSRLVKAGDVVVIPPTSEFYIALGDHEDWSEAHTVVGMVDDFTVVDLIGVQAYEEVEHPDFKTLMRLMKEPVDFVLTTDMSASVMPRYTVEKSVHASVKRIVEDPALHRSYRVHRMDDIGGIDGGLSFSEPDSSVLDDVDEYDYDSAMIDSGKKYTNKRRAPVMFKEPPPSPPSLRHSGKKMARGVSKGKEHSNNNNIASYEDSRDAFSKHRRTSNNKNNNRARFEQVFEDGIENLEVEDLNGNNFEDWNGGLDTDEAFEDDGSLLGAFEEDEENDFNLDKFAKLDFRNLP